MKVSSFVPNIAVFHADCFRHVQVSQILESAHGPSLLRHCRHKLEKDARQLACSRAGGRHCYDFKAERGYCSTKWLLEMNAPVHSS